MPRPRVPSTSTTPHRDRAAYSCVVDREHAEYWNASPLVVAVEVQQEGRWYPCRIGLWAQDASGWWGFVSTGPGDYAAGTRGGWSPVDVLRPAQHEVRTAHLAGDWGTWEPPVWPAELAPFAEAASNLVEQQRWTGRA